VRSPTGLDRLDRSTRRQVQQGLQAAGFDPGGADGLFGPRTRSAIRSWQSARGARSTGYLVFWLRQHERGG
jgi:peptidoglycan hydrolase-like protein with peptidoglycan-binding domain